MSHALEEADIGTRVSVTRAAGDSQRSQRPPRNGHGNDRPSAKAELAHLFKKGSEAALIAGVADPQRFLGFEYPPAHRTVDRNLVGKGRFLAIPYFQPQTVFVRIKRANAEKLECRDLLDLPGGLSNQHW